MKQLFILLLTTSLIAASIFKERGVHSAQVIDHTTVTIPDIKKNNLHTSKPQNSFDIHKNISFQGKMNITGQYYSKKQKKKNPYNLTISTDLGFTYKKDNLKLETQISAQQDYHDISSSEEKKTNRSFIRLDELYATYDFGDNQILFGKNIRFWGALEARNISDVFNSEQRRSDPFYKDKLGIWSTSYTHFTDNGELSFIVKLYEDDREISDYPYAYYPFGNVPLLYDSHLLTEEGKKRPSIFLKYSASTDTEYPLDYALIFQNGYDSQRYYTRLLLPSNEISINENAYLVNKVISYNTLMLNSTLYKLEAIYTDVINNENISDYIHIGVGIEHTFSHIYNENDVSLILEYYRYLTLENNKFNDLQLFEVFQNDLFLGLKYTFNDTQNSSLMLGSIIDEEYHEQIYYLTYETLLADKIKLNFDYRYIAPSDSDKTLFNLMGEHERIHIELGYHF